MLGTQARATLTNLKQLGLSCLDWFKDLPTYQKIITSVAVITGSFITRYVYCKLHKKLNNYPPGPIGLPVLGYGFDPGERSWWKKVAKYDTNNKGVVFIYALGHPIVFITDHELFQKTWKTQLYREANDQLFEGSPQPFTHINGKTWSNRRQLNLLAFTQLINSDYLDKVMNSLLEKSVFTDMDKECTSTSYYYARDDIKWLGFAFLFGVLFGANSQIPDKNDDDFHRFMLLDQLGFAAFNKAVLIRGVPFKSIVNLLMKVVDPYKPFREMLAMVIKWEKTLNVDKNEDTYFNRMSKSIQEGKATKDEIYSDVTTLVSAGLHVTLSAIEIAIYHACQYPEVQDRVYKELNSHYNKYKGFETKRMSELHVFRAFVYESLRYGNPVKMTLARNINKSGFKLGGYNLPPHSTVFGATYLQSRNENHWEKPYELYIEHWMDKDGKFKKSKYLTIFGLGRRDCIGQSFAIKELFCILSALLYRYKFAIPDKEKNNWEIPEHFFMVPTPKLPMIITKR